MQVWEALSARHVQTYKGHSGSSCIVRPGPPDGKYIASASDDTTVQVWEALSARHMQTYRGHFFIVYSAAWSPDSKYIASASDDTYCASMARITQLRMIKALLVIFPLFIDH